MKCIKIVSLMLALMFLVVGMGGKINKEIYTDYEGKRVYFCCKGCIGEFKKDPAKHIKKLEEEGVALEEAPKAGLNKESSHGTDERGKQSKACGGCGGCS